MKTQEEPNALKKEAETANEKLTELTDKELKQVTGGKMIGGGDSASSEAGLRSPNENWEKKGILAG